MGAVSLTVSSHPEKLNVMEGDTKKKYEMSCRFAGRGIPTESPWRWENHKIGTEEGKYDVTRNPEDITEGIVTWTLVFLNVSKTSNVFGNYSCSVKNVTSKNASVTLAGKSLVQVVNTIVYALCIV